MRGICTISFSLLTYQIGRMIRSKCWWYLQTTRNSQLSTFIVIRIAILLLNSVKIMRFGDSKDNCIFVGDYNAHHSQWGCSNTSRRQTSSSIKSIENHYACILNDQHFHRLLLPPNSDLSIVDLTIATVNMAPLWGAEDTCGDHYPIMFKIGINLVLRQRCTPIKLILILKSWFPGHPGRFIRFVCQICHLMKKKYTFD